MALLIAGALKQQFSLGEQGLVALFRGAGGLVGLPNSGESGVDALAANMRESFGDYFWDQRVFDSYSGNIFNFREVGSQQAQEWLNQFDAPGGVGGVGYSGGGLSVTRFSQNQGPGPVNLQIQVDSFDPLTGGSPEDEILPTNVIKGINYYQLSNRSNPFAPDFDLTDLQGAQIVAGAENINAEAFFNDPAITHRNIIDRPALQQQIIQNVEDFLLQDLVFDRFGQLNLQGGTQPVNNLLRLTPGDFGAAGGAIASPIAIDPDFSFETRFQFRLPPTPTSGLAFTLLTEAANGPPELSISFDPLVDQVSLLIPDLSEGPLIQVSTPDLDGGDRTAWLDYDGGSDQLQVFLGDGLVPPETPLFTYPFDLTAITGATAIFGFQTTVAATERQGDLLSWQLQTISGLPTPAVIPDDFLNFSLTRRAAQRWWDISLQQPVFEVGGLDFANLFDEAAYLQQYADVTAAVQAGSLDSGYSHFITHGWLEGRNPSSVYNEAAYLDQYPDVAQAVAVGSLASGIEHFARFGHIEGRNPGPDFDQTTYLTLNPDVADAITSGGWLSGFQHWITVGAAEGRDPQTLLFQDGYYLAQYPDVAAAVAAGVFQDGFDHYLQFGCGEQRRPSPLFNETDYLSMNPDVAAAVDARELPCGFAHYLITGRFEGRAPVTIG